MDAPDNGTTHDGFLSYSRKDREFAAIIEAEARGLEPAFPPTLCEVLGTPLAISYVGFDGQRDAPNKGQFQNSWYALLANIYRCTRSEIEERDRKRRLRATRLRIGIALGVIVALSIALVFALLSRRDAIASQRVADAAAVEARRQEQSASARALAIAAESASSAKNWTLSLLLGVEAYRLADSPADARRAVASAAGISPLRRPRQTESAAPAGGRLDRFDRLQPRRAHARQCRDGAAAVVAPG